ncbi:hypothetical protein SMD22_01345 (plasmid) [Brevibacillus halotolerans]|nr:hypothetical protein SMD22_01345 [Brevibacillus halotolerans]
MNKIKVKQIIMNNIKKSGWYSYPQLIRVLTAEGVQVNGTFQLEMKDKNIILWGGLSEEVVFAITELLEEGRLVGVPAPIELYQMEGLDMTRRIILSVPQERLETSAIWLTFLRYIPEANSHVVSLAQ